MEQYIPKAAVVAEIKRISCENPMDNSWYVDTEELLNFLDSLEVKEVDLDVMQRMEECPYRQVGCAMYNGKILECRGACGWVADHLKLKELKAQKVK